MSAVIQWRPHIECFVAFDTDYDLRMEARTEVDALVELQQAREEKIKRVGYRETTNRRNVHPAWAQAERQLWDEEDHLEWDVER